MSSSPAASQPPRACALQARLPGQTEDIPTEDGGEGLRTGPGKVQVSPSLGVSLVHSYTVKMFPLKKLGFLVLLPSKVNLIDSNFIKIKNNYTDTTI